MRGCAHKPSDVHRPPLSRGHIRPSWVPFLSVRMVVDCQSVHIMPGVDVWFAPSGAILSKRAHPACAFERGRAADAALARGASSLSAPGPAARAASGMLRAARLVLGEKARRGGLCVRPAARISGSLSPAGHDGNGPPGISGGAAVGVAGLPGAPLWTARNRHRPDGGLGRPAAGLSRAYRGVPKRVPGKSFAKRHRPVVADA